MRHALFTVGGFFALATACFAQVIPAPQQANYRSVSRGSLEVAAELVRNADQASSLGSNVPGRFSSSDPDGISIYDLVDFTGDNHPNRSKGEPPFNQTEANAFGDEIDVMKLRGVDPLKAGALQQFQKLTEKGEKELSSKLMRSYVAQGFVAIPDKSVADAFNVLYGGRKYNPQGPDPAPALPDSPAAEKALATVAAYCETNEKMTTLREQVRDARVTKFEKKGVWDNLANFKLLDNMYGLPQGQKPKSPKQAIADAFAAVKQLRTDTAAGASSTALAADQNAVQMAKAHVGHALGLDASRNIGDDEIVGLGLAQQYFEGREDPNGKGEADVGHLLNTPEIRQGVDLAETGGRKPEPLPISPKDRTDITKDMNDYARLNRDEKSDWKSARTTVDSQGKYRDKPGDPVYDEKHPDIDPNHDPKKDPIDHPDHPGGGTGQVKVKVRPK